MEIKMNFMNIKSDFFKRLDGFVELYPNFMFDYQINSLLLSIVDFRKEDICTFRWSHCYPPKNQEIAVRAFLELIDRYKVPFESDFGYTTEEIYTKYLEKVKEFRS